MKIIVTGGAGFIGSALVRHLINSTDHDVLVVDKLTYAGNLSSLAAVENNPRFSFKRVDICDKPAISEIFARYAPDAVMHLAAESHVDRSIDGPSDFINTNIVGTYVLLEAALQYWRKAKIEGRDFRFLHVSTDEVFGALTNEGFFTETTRYDPRSPYSATKAASDHLVRAWGHTFDLPILLTNCSNNYGPNQFPEKLIPLTIIKTLKQEPIPVYGQGENVRDWLFVDDHAQALTLVLERGVGGETYNVGGNAERKNIDVVSTICGVMNELLPRPHGRSYKHLITFVSDRPGHDFRYAINCSKISATLGWAPKHAFEAGLRTTVEWYLANRAWWEPLLTAHQADHRRGIARANA